MSLYRIPSEMVSRGVDNAVENFLLAHFQPTVFLSPPLTSVILQTNSVSVTFSAQQHSGFDFFDHVVEGGLRQIVLTVICAKFLAHDGKDRKLCLE